MVGGGGRPGRSSFKRGRSRRALATAVFLLALIAGAALIFSDGSFGGTTPRDMTMSELVQGMKDGQIRSIRVTGDELLVERTGVGAPVRVLKDPKVDLYATLSRAGVPTARLADVAITYVEPRAGFPFGLVLLVLPIVAIGAAMFWAMRRARGTTGEAMSFGRSRARRFVAVATRVTFADVAGVDEAKEELQEVVEFLRAPEKFAALGARTPRGVLLLGPPGTGKTLIARAVAGEAEVPFFSISGSEFVEMFVGVGASRVRDLFEQARKHAPCIVFVDEIDAVGRQRGAGMGGGNDEREHTLNQMLVEMDGFDSETNVIVIAATNRPDVLDPALLRPGRFDRQVVLDRPDIVGRTAVLDVHRKGKPLAADVDMADLAKQTAGFSGADLANLLNEAAILAARRDRTTIGMSELEEAVDRVVAGPARSSRVVSTAEKRIVAYHEGGHAVVARYLGHLDPLHKVTIVPRGTMGGYTRLLPTEDRYLRSRRELEDTLAFTMGGRMAEEIVFAEASTGAGQDIQEATRLAREMVTGLGMSDRLGPVALSQPRGMAFLGRGTTTGGLYSRVTAEAIDDEVRSLVVTASTRAEAILLAHRDALDRLADALLANETVAGLALDRVFVDDTGPAS